MRGGGDQATDQAPVTRRPNAAQSVVTGGLRAHTRETASLSPRGGGGLCRKWSRRSASPPNACPWGFQQRVRRQCVRVVRARGQEEETKRRAAAIMLSRTGRDRDPPLGRGQTGEGRRAPWGCAAGAPYRGTASPPAAFLFCGSQRVCVCVCVCVPWPVCGDQLTRNITQLTISCAVVRILCVPWGLCVCVCQAVVASASDGCAVAFSPTSECVEPERVRPAVSGEASPQDAKTGGGRTPIPVPADRVPRAAPEEAVRCRGHSGGGRGMGRGRGGGVGLCFAGAQPCPPSGEDCQFPAPSLPSGRCATARTATATALQPPVAAAAAALDSSIQPPSPQPGGVGWDKSTALNGTTAPESVRAHAFRWSIVFVSVRAYRATTPSMCKSISRCCGGVNRQQLHRAFVMLGLSL